MLSVFTTTFIIFTATFLSIFYMTTYVVHLSILACHLPEIMKQVIASFCANKIVTLIVTTSTVNVYSLSCLNLFTTRTHILFTRLTSSFTTITLPGCRVSRSLSTTDWRNGVTDLDVDQWNLEHEVNNHLL